LFGKFFGLILILGLSGMLAFLLVHSVRSHANPRDYQAPTADVWKAYLAPDQSCPGSGDYLAPKGAQERAMACLIDYARARYGRLHPGWGGQQALPLNDLLLRAAKLKAQLLIRCHQFSHTPCNTPFPAIFREVGYGRGDALTSVGENLAYGQQEEGSPRAALDNWLNSPEHRQNLFTAKWRVQGLQTVHLASFQGYSNVSLWVSEFGAER
jgi:uncharacterized protein YkwD